MEVVNKYSIKKIYEDEDSKTYSVCEVDPNTREILSVIGIFNYKIDKSMSEQEVNNIIAEKIKDIALNRSPQKLTQLNHKFESIVKSF